MGDEWLSDRLVEAESAIGGFDLSECVREPIHLLGGIQTHGTLLAADPRTGVIVVAAENCAELLGAGPRELVGGPVGAVLGATSWAEVLEATAEAGNGQVMLPVDAPAGAAPGRRLTLSAHRLDELVVLEFEAFRGGAPFEFSPFYQRVRRALARLRSASTVGECCELAVREMRALTGFDRVVVYRFDGADGPGEVIAEDLAPGREPWLGLWFPATDIPPQARRLYTENWIRLIADVDDPSAGLFPPLLAETGAPLDLSQATLRTVSGFHLEYLRNIGVSSSMSVSVLREDALWGLIACHGDAPVHLSPELRSACEFFGVAFSLQLTALEEREHRDALLESRRRMSLLLHAVSPDLAGSVEAHGDELRTLLDADAALVLRDGRVTVSGAAVPDATVALLRDRAAGMAPGSVWSTDRLAEATGAQDLPAGIAGALLIALDATGDFLAWMRGERTTTRSWAADPALPVRLGPRGERLTPRGSSAVFRAEMRGRSLPWTAADEATAEEFWRAVSGLLLRHADGLAALNEELRAVNLDLDSFAHAAAHDLKEPLRGISNAATFALEDAGDSLDPVTVRRLTTTRRLAERMDELLNSLLHYARLGRAGLRREPVDLGSVLDGALEVAGERLAEAGVRVERAEVLPVVDADPHRLYEVLVNLLVNAAKYAGDHEDRWVRVYTLPAVPPSGGPEVLSVVVEDNGIGIPVERHREVFQLFRRLHQVGERGGGTGVGLAVVKRIVERHGGELWLTGEPGRGTAFRFTLGE
ncbi:ATP-binding protein [Streptomyces sp. NPDC090112]|uniref:ATP-binding protein n=1 Tax=Streptomyces sp. NPDC090112 TaxID=3365949 RepID=UPI00380E9A0A